MKNLKFLFAFLVYFAVLSCSAVPSQKDTKKGELGLSISNPIKVNSVPEEYQYIRENCEGCKVIKSCVILHSFFYFHPNHFSTESETSSDKFTSKCWAIL